MPNYGSIVISGKPVSGKSTLQARLAEEYSLVPNSIGGMWRDRYKKLYPNNEITFEEYWRGTSTEDNAEVNRQAKTTYEGGGYVGDSRFVSYLDPSKCLLIFVTAPVEIRAARASARADYESMPVAEITKVLEAREQDELRMGKTLFGVDYRDPKIYHAVLNSGVLTVEQEVGAVRALMGARRV